MKVIHLQQYTFDENCWYSAYLANMASNPRNSVEMQLEPLTQVPGSHIRIIDTKAPEEIAPDGYPTAGMSVYWMVICLDGAPERMNYLTHKREIPYHTARQILSPAEERFRALVASETEAPLVRPSVKTVGPWFDGAVLGYESHESAVSAAKRIGEACHVINAAEKLSWIHQFHVRAGVGHSVRRAFSALVCSQCDQVSYHPGQAPLTVWNILPR